jgi:peptide/nickel transport system substrate-binding protein
MTYLTSLRCLSLTVLLGLISACTPTTPPTTNTSATDTKFGTRVAGTRGGTLTYRITSPPKTFNYLVAEDEPSILTALYLLNSRPVEFDHMTQGYRAALAESWTFAGDRQTVDLQLREGIKFSDGHPITTADLAFTLAAMYDERTLAGSWKDSMSVNGKPIATRIVDERNMQFIFPEPVAAFENYLDNLAVLPKHVLGADMEAGKLAEAWKVTAAPGTIVTSGPFTVESAVAGERVVLKRNPHFWRKDEKGTQLPYVDRLALEVVSDSNQALVRLNQNTIDILDRIRPADYASLLNSTGGVKAYDVGPGLGVDHIWFNLNKTTADGKPVGDPKKRAWFSDKRFRQAVSAAVDRTSIAATTLQGLATPLHSYIPPANRAWADPNAPKIEYSLTRAAQLLADAGFVKRGSEETPELYDAAGDRVEFSLMVPAENEPRKLMAAVIQQDLAKLGIKMNVVPVEFTAVTTAWTRSFDYDAILLGLSVSGVEPTTYANFLLSSAAVHQWQPSQKTPATEWEAEIDKLFTEQAGQGDPQKRAATLHEIERIVREESPVIPIVARHIVSAANARVGNYAPSVIFPYSLWNVEEIFIKQ